MADNVPISAGSGTNIATDQLGGGEHVQYVKLMDGTLDGNGKIGGDATNGLDVDVTRVQGTVTVNPTPATSGGLSISRVISAATTNATSVKASAGQVYTIMAHNTNAAVRYLKLYNKASSPTVGSDTPVLTFPIPGSTAGAGFTLDTGGLGIAFATGIALALTTGVADADTSAVAANEIVINLLYK
jgi:hypothetical protein